ncbi:hypothetical protein [Noviherbaspirillum sp. Root189]|nr:hypothetical protein [Noviherbaspirillum sp. Root189]
MLNLAKQFSTLSNWRPTNTIYGTLVKAREDNGKNMIDKGKGREHN